MTETPSRIATYSAEGKRIRDYSLEALLRLARLRKVYFTFSRRGRLLHATFLPHEGTILKTAHMGQRYSYPERVGETAKAWRHAPLFALRDAKGSPLPERETELFIRAVFRAVPLSCLRRESEPPPPAKAKVVSIAEGKRAAARCELREAA